MPTKINFGRSCLSELIKVAKLGLKRKILIFTGAKSAKVSGALEQVKSILSRYQPIVFDGIESNPDIESLSAGIELCRKERIDLIVSVGGGSVMDYGKAVSVLSKERGKPQDFLYKRRKLKGDKIIFFNLFV